MYRSQKAITCLVLLLLMAARPLEARRKVVSKPVYMIGVGMSLVDSTVFITDMHLVDSVTLERRTRFLKDRQLYSFQLQRYLEHAQGGGPYVPGIFFGKGRRKMERRYLSLHKRYVQDKYWRMVLIDQGQFRFKAEEYIDEALDDDKATTPHRKKGKKK